MTRYGLLAFSAVGLCCSRKQVEREQAPIATSTASSPAASSATSGCELVPDPLRLPAPGRVIAIGDLHGDIGAMQAALRAGGAIDAVGRWNGGDLVVVQTGDILDRGDDEQAIMDWLERLEQEAKAAGGAMVWLLGNHELMNAAGDFRYVTAAGFADFEDVSGLDLSTQDAIAQYARARKAAFATSPRPGPYAQILSGQNVVRIVGDSVFSHAGVVGEWARRADAVNLETRCWLAGKGGLASAPPVVADDTGPVWTRVLGTDPVDCALVRRSLDTLGVVRMVVGHTVQPDGISTACDGALWRIDVGLAAGYGGPIQVLEIVGATVRPLRGQRTR
jgi:Calcineurin-like phosphoesterase